MAILPIRQLGDPVLRDYFRIFDASIARGEAAGMPYQHLIVHGDAEGYYLPVEFDDVIIPDPSLEIAGGMLGSSHALLRECRELAGVLELPEDLSLEDEATAEGFGEIFDVAGCVPTRHVHEVELLEHRVN